LTADGKDLDREEGRRQVDASITALRDEPTSTTTIYGRDFILLINSRQYLVRFTAQSFRAENPDSI
jgi:hypothetical protein